MHNPKPAEEAPLITLLRKQVLQKISDEWNQWRINGHGQNFEGIEALPSKRAFYIDLQLEIRAALATKFGAVKAADLMPSDDTLIRFFEPKKVSKYRSSTLEALAVYAGYEGYAHFKAKHIHLFQPPTFALIHIKRLHQQSNEARRTALQVRKVFEEKAYNPNIEDIEAIELKPRYKNRYLFLAGAAIAFVLVIGLFYEFAFRPINIEQKKRIDFTELNFDRIDDPGNAIGKKRITFQYDYSATGADTLNLEFEKSLYPEKLTLTKPKGTFSLFAYTTGQSVLLSAKNEYFRMAFPMGGGSKWHYKIIDLGSAGLNANFSDIHFPTEKYTELVQNGYINLPVKLVPTEFQVSYVPELSSFGLFPKISLNNFTLEYRFKYLAKISNNQREFNCALYCHNYLEAELPTADSGWGTDNWFYFGHDFPVDRNIKGIFETSPSVEWNTIRLVVRNRYLKYYINNKVHFQSEVNYSTDSLLWGMAMTSNCNVGLDYIRFTDGKGNLLYANEFNDPKTVNAMQPDGKTYLRLCGVATDNKAPGITQ